MHKEVKQLKNGESLTDAPKHEEPPPRRSTPRNTGWNSNASLRRTRSAMGNAVVQFYAGQAKTTDVQQAAAQGLSGTSTSLPHADKIQASFGHHKIKDTPAYMGPQAKEASQSLGANAYASRGAVVFGQQPDLHTAAHEAAHVVQQRSGLTLPGEQGQAGDSHEASANAVADLVVQGKSAESLLDKYATPGANQISTNVQRQEISKVGDDEALQSHSDIKANDITASEEVCHDESDDFLKGLKDWVERLEVQLVPMWESRRQTGDMHLNKVEFKVIRDLNRSANKIFAKHGQGDDRAEGQNYIKSILSEKAAYCLTEMHAFHANTNAPTRSLLDTCNLPEPEPALHEYKLSISGGISFDPAKLGAKLSERAAELLKKLEHAVDNGKSIAKDALHGLLVDVIHLRIHYKGSTSLQWSKDLVCFKLGVEVGKSFTATMEGSKFQPDDLPGVTVPTGTFTVGSVQFNSPSTIKLKNYVSPNDFNDATLGFMILGKFDVGPFNYSFHEHLQLFTHNERMYFDIQGAGFGSLANVKAGAQLIAGGMGACMGDEEVDDYKIEEIKEEDRTTPESKERLFATISLYFKTDDDDITQEHREVLQTVQQEIKARSQYLRTKFRMEVVGKASSRWRACSPSERQPGESDAACKVRLNDELARDRAQAVGEVLEDMEGKINNLLPQMTTRIQPSPTQEGQENAPQWRAVDVRVYWHPCAPDNTDATGDP